MADLQDAARRLGLFHQRLGAGDIIGDRFFHKHVHAVGEHIAGDGKRRRSGDRNAGRRDPAVQGFMIDERLFGAEFLSHGAGPRRIQIDHGDKPGNGIGSVMLGVKAAEITCADNGHWNGRWHCKFACRMC